MFSLLLFGWLLAAVAENNLILFNSLPASAAGLILLEFKFSPVETQST